MGRFTGGARQIRRIFPRVRLCKQMLREVTKQGVAQAVDAFEMLEK